MLKNRVGNRRNRFAVQLVSTFVQRNLCRTASRNPVTAPPTLHADALMSGNSAISASTPSPRRGFNLALRTSFATASLRSLQAGARDGLSQPPGPLGRHVPVIWQGCSLPQGIASVTTSLNRRVNNPRLVKRRHPLPPQASLKT
jgi:hypothetical protein